MLHFLHVTFWGETSKNRTSILWLVWIPMTSWQCTKWTCSMTPATHHLSSCKLGLFIVYSSLSSFCSILFFHRLISYYFSKCFSYKIDEIRSYARKYTFPFFSLFEFRFFELVWGLVSHWFEKSGAREIMVDNVKQSRNRASTVRL